MKRMFLLGLITGLVWGFILTDAYGQDVFFEGQCTVQDSVEITGESVEIWTDGPLLHHKENGIEEMFIILMDSIDGNFHEVVCVSDVVSRNYIFVEAEGYYIGAVLVYEKRLCQCCQQFGREPKVMSYRKCNLWR